MSLYGAFEVAKCSIRQVQSPKNAIFEKFVHQNKNNSYTTKKFRNFYPKSKKLYLLSNSDAQIMVFQIRATKSKLHLKMGL